MASLQVKALSVKLKSVSNYSTVYHEASNSILIATTDGIYQFNINNENILMLNKYDNTFPQLSENHLHMIDNNKLLIISCEIDTKFNIILNEFDLKNKQFNKNILIELKKPIIDSWQEMEVNASIFLLSTNKVYILIHQGHVTLFVIVNLKQKKVITQNFVPNDTDCPSKYYIRYRNLIYIKRTNTLMCTWHRKGEIPFLCALDVNNPNGKWKYYADVPSLVHLGYDKFVVKNDIIIEFRSSVKEILCFDTLLQQKWYKSNYSLPKNFGPILNYIIDKNNNIHIHF